MKRLDFSYNWNNKLDCKAFTTLRLSDRFKKGEKITIFLKQKLIGSGEIVEIKSFHITGINDYIAYLDTGYDSIECQAILKRMYKNKNINWSKQRVYFYLIKKD